MYVSLSLSRVSSSLSLSLHLASLTPLHSFLPLFYATILLLFPLSLPSLPSLLFPHIPPITPFPPLPPIPLSPSSPLHPPPLAAEQKGEMNPQLRKAKTSADDDVLDDGTCLRP
eukprot:2964314-Rhodomonas_salina.3